ncbi:MAG: hypothetical protein WC878_05805 [Candidatus Paceibacterota bacterium]|jgi:hypothetical protein
MYDGNKNAGATPENHRWYDILGVWAVGGVIGLCKLVYRLSVLEVRFLGWLGGLLSREK